MIYKCKKYFELSLQNGDWYKFIVGNEYIFCFEKGMILFYPEEVFGLCQSIQISALKEHFTQVDF